MSIGGTSFASYLTVLHWGPPSPNVVIPTVGVAARSGLFSAKSWERDRDLVVDCHIQAGSLSQAFDRLDAVDLAMKANDEVDVIFDELSTRRWPAIPNGRSDFTRKRFDLLFRLFFLMKDPFSYAVTPESTIELASLSGGGSPQQASTPVIGGNRDSWGVWELRHDVALSGSKSITLENLTAGTVMTHEVTLPSGTSGYTRYQGRRGLAELSTDAGATWTKAMAGHGGVFPFLVPGAQNVIRVTTDDPVTVRIDYSKAYGA